MAIILLFSRQDHLSQLADLVCGDFRGRFELPESFRIDAYFKA